jgi:hypothetical protein
MGFKKYLEVFTVPLVSLPLSRASLLLPFYMWVYCNTFAAIDD